MAVILIPENPLERNVLAAIRTLGRKGHEIHVAYPVDNIRLKNRYLNAVIKSRYIYKLNYIPHPLSSTKAFFDEIFKMIRQEKYDVLMPFTSKTFPVISLHSEELSRYTNHICCDYATYSKANDKEKITSIASEFDLPVPKSIWPKSFEEIATQISHLDFPVVIKARIGSGMQKGLRYAKNLEEAIKGYKEISSQKSIEGVKEFHRPLIQEYIPGKIYDALYYYHNGNLVASLTQCREITNPISGGPGVQNVTVKDGKLHDYGKTILDGLRWHGPAQVELKLDPRDNQFKLLEVNPKFWGTLDLSIKCGVNFPAMAVDLALNGLIRHDMNKEIGPGLRYRWLVSFVKTHRAAGFPRRKIIRSLINRVQYNDLDFNDPLPTFYNIALAVRSLLKKKDQIRSDI
jgi:predicted ATP-grasp superfamily ATP-dependent carboligase